MGRALPANFRLYLLHNQHASFSHFSLAHDLILRPLNSHDPSEGESHGGVSYLYKTVRGSPTALHCQVIQYRWGYCDLPAQSRTHSCVWSCPRCCTGSRDWPRLEWDQGCHMCGWAALKNQEKQRKPLPSREVKQWGKTTFSVGLVKPAVLRRSTKQSSLDTWAKFFRQRQSPDRWDLLRWLLSKVVIKNTFPLDCCKFISSLHDLCRL